MGKGGEEERGPWVTMEAGLMGHRRRKGRKTEEQVRKRDRGTDGQRDKGTGTSETERERLRVRERQSKKKQ
jgi:hypothetical protein